MKKKVFSLMMMLLLAVTGFVRAAEITVHDGTVTSSYIPVWGMWTDNSLQHEFVYPASELAGMSGAQISSLKFYTTSSYANVSWNGSFKVYVKEVGVTTLSSFLGISDATLVYEGSLGVSSQEMTINFTTPYTYNGSNLWVAVYYTATTGYNSSYWYGETVSGNAIYGRSGNSYTVNTTNFLPKTTFTYTGGGGGGGAGAGEQIFAMQDEQIVDTVYVGARPNGCWMEPFTFQLINNGAATTITNIDWTPLDYFTLVAPELPVAIGSNETIDVQLTTGDSDNTDWQMVALYGNTRLAAIWNVKVEPYDPICPDVVEVAYDIDEEENQGDPLQPGFSTQLNARQIHMANGGDGELHNDYTLPFPEIEDGYDAVYKFSVENDAMLNAIMNPDAYQGKVALYRQEGEELPHPMADNNYTGITLGMNTSANTTASFTAQIGEGTSTSVFMPFYCLYNYSCSQQLFLAAELQEACVTLAPMTSLSWYCTASNGNQQNNITIWMGNVEETSMGTSSVVTGGMTKVYEGSMTPVAEQWNEFVFNQDSFAWDGHSNILVSVQRNNGSWASGFNWQASAQSFTASGYLYNDSGVGAYNMATTSYTFGTSGNSYGGTSTSRANIIMKGRESGDRNSLTQGFEDGMGGWTMSNCVSGSQIYNGDANTGSSCFRFQWSTNPPQYLISPELDANDGGTVSFYCKRNSANWVESYKVGYSSTTNDPTAFTFGPEVTITSALYAEQTATFPAGTKYIAIASTANDAFYFYVDDITITTTGGGNQGSGNEALNISAGPEITNLPLIPGTYYLVSSALTSDDDHLVNFAIDTMPCPAVDAEGFALNPSPADDDTVGVQPSNVTLRWMVPEYTTRWRIIIGSTYWPELNHPYTQYYPQDEDGNWTWSTTIANSWNVPEDLFNNTNYFWRVEFANDGCVDGVSSPVFGFTTHLNIPENLVVEDETVFEEDTIRLSWRAVVDRTYRRYYIYRNYGPVSNSADVFEKIGETTEHDIDVTSFEDGPLSYNMNGYTYYVTAVYDEGESHPSNTVNVKVSGKGFVNGHVFEQDGVVGIANATVHMVGNDEFGGSHTYDFITDSTGYYEGTVYATTPNDGNNSNGYNGSATCLGYQPIDHPVQGNPIEVVYNQTTTPIDYMLDENFYGPCGVVAQYYPDSTDVNAEYVKVYWGCGLPTGAIVEDFEDFENSEFEWQNDATHPWTIVATNPYEGESCLKSGGAGVSNVNSNLSVTVNIPQDGVMSFYGKISCENNWDYGYFYIDGVQKGSYTGAGSWTERTFDITAGEHTFKWSYTKDSSLNSNDDCFYIDYITFYRPEESQARNDENRAFSHYRVYRTNCYNPGPYDSIPNDVEPFYPNPMSTSVLSCEVTDTVFIDTYWADPEITPPGVYKWGVGCVYVGNRGEEIESPITWSEPVNVVPAAAVTETRDVVTIGDGTGTTYYGPYNSLWGYSFVEQVYTAAEIGTAGTINSISFNMLESEADQTNQIDVFMKNVSRTSFADNADWEPVTNSDKVFSGTVTFQGGWTTITLDNPFYYNGTDNLMIGMHEYTSGYSTRYFYYTTVSNALISGHSDTSDPDPTNMAAFTGTKYVQNYRNNIQIDITPGGGGGSGTPDNPYPAGNEPIQEERESVIVWSNCLDKDMYINPVDVTVLLNSADSPEGAVVTLTNLNEVEEDAYGVDPVTLDESGFYAWETFRRGHYAVKVELEGYYTLYDTADIWNAPTHLRYVLIEQLNGVSNVYVSRTGWAMWDEPMPNGGGNGGNQGGGEGDTFTEGFENGIPADWTLIDGGSTPGYGWQLASTVFDATQYAHTGSDFVLSQSYQNGYGPITPDNFLITPQVNLGGSSVLSFWACAQDSNDINEHFGVAVSTTGTNASDFTMVQEWTIGRGNAMGTSTREIRGDRQTAWQQYTCDLSAYAGQQVYLAIRHFNCNNQFYLDVDDIELSNGSRSDDRHFEYYKVMCTSIDGVPIYNHNVVVPMCQLSTDEPYNAPLVEGDTYLCKVAVMYSTGMSAWSEPVAWVYEPCDHWGPVDDVAVTTLNQGNHIEWVFEHGFNPYANDSLNPDDPQGGDNATIILTVGDVWGDGTGYQMLLDADANAFGTTIPETGALSMNCSGNEAIYAEFEYKIPTNADGNCSTQNIVLNNSISLTIPAGTYDWCITNPTPGDRIWIASAQGNVGGRQDDYTFEAGSTYEFTVTLQGQNDATNVVITGGAKNAKAPLPAGEVKNLANVIPGDYGYIVRPEKSGVIMMGDKLMFNITSIHRYDERVYFLYNLMKDGRFDVINAESDGCYIVVPSVSYNNLDVEEAFNEFRAQNAANFAQLSKEEIVEVTMQYKNSLPDEYIVSLMSDMTMRSRENDHCEEALPFCTEMETYQYPAGTNQPYNYHDPLSQQEGGPIDFSCLISQPNQAWYYFRIGEPGQLNIRIETNPSEDIDFCCWGPFEDPHTPCPNGLTTDKVADCSFSAAHTENCMIPSNTYSSHTPETGEYYILVLTNYSASQTDVTFWSVGDATTDCNIVNPTVDIIGFLITMDGEYLDIVGPDVRDYLHEGEYGEHTYCVRPIYPGEMVLPDHNYGWSMGCPVCQETGGGFTCLPGDPIHAEVLGATDQVKIWWGEQEPEPEPFFEDFEGGELPEGWLSVRDGGGTEATDWRVINGETAFSSGPMPAHSGTYMVMGRSWSGSAYSVDNWLITPQVNLGGMLSYWVQDDGQYHENVDVYVSTTTTDINAFTLLADPASATADWSERTVDLTSYNGQMGYIAFRLVDNDQDYIFIDDVTIGAGRRNRAEIDHYNVYRSEDNIDYAVVGTVNYVEGQTYYEYIDTPAAAGTYYYKVTAVYDDDCESDGAPAFDNPDNNYVQVEVTGLDENNDKVALYPNPTNGNVTIEANGMNRIIVVGVLGQVVFDTELDADSYTLNMGQFNAGMYMVRVYTEDGVTVKRVTVMK